MVDTTGCAQAAVLEQVVHEQAHDLELVDERALLVGRAGPVGVAVEQQAEVVAAAGRGCPAPRRCSGAMGSGLTPPNHGLRSEWISVTRILPPASRRGIQPAPAPHIGSTSTRMSAAFSRSRSSERLVYST